jgi:hypothetical protein
LGFIGARASGLVGRSLGWSRRRFGHVCTDLGPSLSRAAKRRQAKERRGVDERLKRASATLQLSQRQL